MSGPTPADLRWLDSAARLARPTSGSTGIHPPSAALVVDPRGVLLGRALATPEAMPEFAALEEAGEAAAGATLYVTLAPESQATIAAGIARVVVGTVDPATARHEADVEELEEAGIEVVIAVHAASETLIEAYAMRLRRGRPFVTLRLAVSRDGMVADRDGRASVVGSEAQRWIELQRALSDAVMVGARTAEVDDERLDSALPGFEERPFTRIVVLGGKTLSPRHFLARSAATRPTLVLAASGRGVALPDGVELMQVSGRSERPDLRMALVSLGLRGVSALLVEGGPRLTEAMLSSEMVDRFYLVESLAEIGRGGLPATALGTLEGRLRAAGLIEVEALLLGDDRLRTFEARA